MEDACHDFFKDRLMQLLGNSTNGSYFFLLFDDGFLCKFLIYKHLYKLEI